MQKIIGISTRSSKLSFETRDSLACDWHLFMEKVLPEHAWVMLPNSINNIKKLCNSILFGGFILSGGDDIYSYPERDETEKYLLDVACKEYIPVIGVCRGALFINHYFNGTIQENSSNSHRATRHRVVCQQPYINQNKSIECNSYHNFIIQKETLAKSLCSFATVIEENQETIEGFYHCSLPLYGIIWHPEREKNVTIYDEKFFRKVFGA